MEQNPLMQENKINTFRLKFKSNLERAFDNPKELDLRIDEFILRLDDYEKGGLIFDKEEITRGMKESLNIKDRDAFVSHLLKILDPIIVLGATHAYAIEKISREAELNSILKYEGSFKLSEVLYARIGENEEENEVRIHLLTATELIKEKGLGFFKKDVEGGLIKLAEILKSQPKVETIYATSWIVAKNPALLKKMGFSVGNEIPEEDKERYSNGREGPISISFMKREAFLGRYGI